MLIRCRKCGKWGESAHGRLTERVKEQIGPSATANAANVCMDCTEDFARRTNIPVEILWTKN